MPRVEIKKRVSILLTAFAALLLLWINSFSNGRPLPTEPTIRAMIADFVSFGMNRSMIFFAGLLLADMYSAEASDETSQSWTTTLWIGVGCALLIPISLLLLFSTPQIGDGVFKGWAAVVFTSGLAGIGTAIWTFFGLISELKLIKSRSADD